MEWRQAVPGLAVRGSVPIVFENAVRLIAMHMAMADTEPREYRQWETEANLPDWPI